MVVTRSVEESLRIKKLFKLTWSEVAKFNKLEKDRLYSLSEIPINEKRKKLLIDNCLLIEAGVDGNRQKLYKIA